MPGITSLRIQDEVGTPELSLNALYRRENGDLPLPHLREFAVLGFLELNRMVSARKIVAERNGSIRTLTVPSILEHNEPQLWESLRSLVPDFRVCQFPLCHEHILIETALNPDLRTASIPKSSRLLISTPNPTSKMWLREGYRYKQTRAVAGLRLAAQPARTLYCGTSNSQHCKLLENLSKRGW